jgi:glycosyltransferase involved in cell wall biosynthesis
MKTSGSEPQTKNARARALVVLGWPAFANKTANPYQSQLYESMQRVGAVVLECTPRNILLSSYDVLHLHWPEHQFSGPTLFTAIGRAVRFFLIIAMARLRKARIVWTAHNLHPHADNHPRLNQFCRRLLFRSLSGVISLNAAVKNSLEQGELKELSIPIAVIPHGHYRASYVQEVDRRQARSSLGIDRESGVVFGWVGQIKHYKGLPELLSAWKAFSNREASLLIAGEVSDSSLKPLLTEAVAYDPRIRFFPGWIAPERIQYFLKASDVIVLPFKAISNSGSALLALSFNIPVVLPHGGATEELQAAVGKEWVYLYHGIISASTLAEVRDWIGQPRGDIPPLDFMDWDRLAAETLAFFARLVGRG